MDVVMCGSEGQYGWFWSDLIGRFSLALTVLLTVVVL
jgi:hypothetical protein